MKDTKRETEKETKGKIYGKREIEKRETRI